MPSQRNQAKFNTLRTISLRSLNSIYHLLISPFIHTLCGPSFGCRFIPTCSEYAVQAIDHHGWVKGGILSFWRICRCQPFARAGYDPVPRGIANSLNPNQGR